MNNFNHDNVILCVIDIDFCTGISVIRKYIKKKLAKK